MKDFVTGADIDIQGLMKVVQSTERRPAEKFSMNYWCGTSCCMIGSFIAEHEEDPLCIVKDDPALPKSEADPGRTFNAPTRAIEGYFKFEDFFADFYAIAIRFGLSFRAAKFLFDLWLGDEVRSHETPDQAASRLRKYLYYKMRKSELLADYDKSRRLEGDVCFVDNDASRLEEVMV